MKRGVFATWAQLYRERGFWPRPIAAGTKACPVKGWQKPDDQRAPHELVHWLEQFGACGIGLLLGSPLPDGTRLGAVDIDRDDYVRVTEALLRRPPCGRIGARGAAYFVRVSGDLSYRQIKAHDGSKIGEVLVTKRLLVIPSTIHPDTRREYRWLGAPLLEVDFRDLPLLEISQ